MGLNKWLRLTENSTYVCGVKTNGGKKRGGGGLEEEKQLFNLCKFDLGRVTVHTYKKKMFMLSAIITVHLFIQHTIIPRMPQKCENQNKSPFIQTCTSYSKV